MGKTSANPELRMPGGVKIVGTEQQWLVIAESQRAEDNKGWKHSCGTDVQGLEVAFSVYDSPIPLSGRGEVHREVVPYCPVCELVPAFLGILTYDGKIAKYDISAATEQSKLRAIR